MSIYRAPVGDRFQRAASICCFDLSRHAGGSQSLRACGAPEGCQVQYLGFALRIEESLGDSKASSTATHGSTHDQQRPMALEDRNTPTKPSIQGKKLFKQPEVFILTSHIPNLLFYLLNSLPRRLQFPVAPPQGGQAQPLTEASKPLFDLGLSPHSLCPTSRETEI